jgi:hypothetical protein
LTFSFWVGFGGGGAAVGFDGRGLRGGLSWGNRESIDDDRLNLTIRLGFEPLPERSVAGGVETLDNELDPRRSEFVVLVFPPMICDDPVSPWRGVLALRGLHTHLLSGNGTDVGLVGMNCGRTVMKLKWCCRQWIATVQFGWPPNGRAKSGNVDEWSVASNQINPVLVFLAHYLVRSCDGDMSDRSGCCVGGSGDDDVGASGGRWRWETGKGT